MRNFPFNFVLCYKVWTFYISSHKDTDPTRCICPHISSFIFVLLKKSNIQKNGPFIEVNISGKTSCNAQSLCYLRSSEAGKMLSWCFPPEPAWVLWQYRALIGQVPLNTGPWLAEKARDGQWGVGWMSTGEIRGIRGLIFANLYIPKTLISYTNQNWFMDLDPQQQTRSGCYLFEYRPSDVVKYIFQIFFARFQM